MFNLFKELELYPTLHKEDACVAKVTKVYGTKTTREIGSLA